MMKRRKYKGNHYKGEPDDIVNESMNDEFAFVAGYTSWGYPYGLRWEDVGINPERPLEEKQKMYTYMGTTCRDEQDEDLPF